MRRSRFYRCLMQKWHRRSIRLPRHDYTNGTYFVTICTQQRSCIFGEIITVTAGARHAVPLRGVSQQAVPLHNEYGKIVDRCLRDIPLHFPSASIDAYVIMPNHIHMIITCRGGTACRAPTTRQFSQPIAGSLATIIGAFKSATTRLIRAAGYCGVVWQRNYHESCVRTQNDLLRIRRYIHMNPQNWQNDSQFHKS